MRRPNASAAVLAAAVLGGLVAVAALLWSHPRVLLYVLLAIIGILTYAAIYLIISTKMHPEDELQPPPRDDALPGDEDSSGKRRDPNERRERPGTGGEPR
jgi:hypothetical protein